jgi:hypothetical protein
MSYLGLTPSEYSSGGQRRQGGITKTGNTHARKALVEGAWCYRFSARLSRPVAERRSSNGKAIRDIAWRAQLRLCSRYRRLCGRGMHSNKICVAVAREPYFHLGGRSTRAGQHALSSPRLPPQRRYIPGAALSTSQPPDPIGNAIREHDPGSPRLDYVGVHATVPDYQTEAAPRPIVDLR